MTYRLQCSRDFFFETLPGMLTLYSWFLCVRYSGANSGQYIQIGHVCLLNISMEHNLSSEADSFSASQILRIFLDCLEIQFSIVVPSTPRSSKWFFSQNSPPKPRMHLSSLSLALIRTTCPSHILLLDFITRIELGEEYRP